MKRSESIPKPVANSFLFVGYVVIAPVLNCRLLVYPVLFRSETFLLILVLGRLPVAEALTPGISTRFPTRVALIVREAMKLSIAGTLRPVASENGYREMNCLGVLFSVCI